MHSSRSVCRYALAFLVALAVCRVVKADPPTVGFTAIAVRNNAGTNTERSAGEGDGLPSRSIDGDFNTATYLTTAFTSTAFSPQHTYLDLASPQYITGFRWSKTDGYVDPHNLSFLISTDSGALLSRTFNAVTNLHNGYFGAELVNGSFAGNSITGENEGAGLYSVTFDPIAGATAIRFDFSSSGSFDHYHVNEFQAIVPEPASLGLICAMALTCLRRRR